MTSEESDLRSNSRETLPVPPTRLIGREQEVEQLCRLLSDTDVRLVTLIGPGGVGKTRLALEVAHQTRDLFADGVWWIDLAPLHNVELAVSAMANTLGLEEHGELTPLSALTGGLRDRQALLVLDNIEQVQDIAASVAELVAWCPDLRVLATGRTPLDVRVEQQYPVDPLPVAAPDTPFVDEELMGSHALALFAERAKAANPRFTLSTENAAVVADICAWLDGLPLAIELVAAQLHVLDLGQVLTRLKCHQPLIVNGARDLPVRQQTMDQTIAWSYNLLTPDERELFLNLGVFAGGFSLEAAGAITASMAEPDRPGDVLPGVSALVRRSLLHRYRGVQEESRFKMLELTRAFALDQLATRGEDERVRREHAHHFLDLAVQAESEIGGPDGDTWLHRLAADHDNLRTALAWALEVGASSIAAQLATALSRFWFVRGHLREGRSWLERVHTALEDERSTERVAVLGALGVLTAALGDQQDGARWAEDALQLARELGDEATIATALHRRGTVARGRGDFAEAARHFEDALTLFRRIGDPPGTAAALNNLAIVAADQGNTPRSRRLLEEAFQVYQRAGNRRGMGITLCNLGQRVAETDGNRAAAAYYQKALPLFQAVGDSAGIAWVLQAVAMLVAEDDAMTQAARLYGAAEAHRESIGWHFSAQERGEYDRGVVALREQMGERAYRDAVTAGRELAAQHAIAEVLAAIHRLQQRGVTSHLQAAPAPAGLSEREVEVLRLVADGLTNAEIAHRLVLSPHTVDAHLRRIYRKLEVRSRSAASRFAVEHHLV